MIFVLCFSMHAMYIQCKEARACYTRNRLKDRKMKIECLGVCLYVILRYNTRKYRVLYLIYLLRLILILIKVCFLTKRLWFV